MNHRTERLGPAPLRDERLGVADDLEGPRFAFLAGRAPGRDAVPAQDAADRLRIRRRDRGDIQPQLEAGTPPRHPHHPVAEALGRQPLAVRGRRERDARVRVQVVDVRRVDQGVHRGVDRRRRPALAVQAVVERGHHLVLALDSGVGVDERAQPVQPQHRQATRAQRAEIAAGALDPEQVDRRAGHRVRLGALRRRVAARVVRVARIGAQPVRAGDQLVDGLAHAPHPAWLPPTRSATIRSA